MPYEGRKFTDVMCHPDRLEQPLHWKKPRKIFVNSMSDLFHEDVPFTFIAEVFWVMRNAEAHIFQVLTKRPERMIEFFEWAKTYPFKALSNVWLGVSVENQDTFEERHTLLLNTPAAVRWLSIEPFLWPVDIDFNAIEIGLEKDGSGTGAIMGGIDWVVVGGESGPRARPMNPDWVRDIRDQCQAADVPFLFKQWGEWGPNLNGTVKDAMQKIGKKKTGRLLDGVLHDEYPG